MPLGIEVAGAGQRADTVENGAAPLNQVIARGALPFDGEAATLVPEVVCALPCQEHPGAAGEGEEGVVVLQKHQGPAYRLPGEGPMLGATEHRLLCKGALCRAGLCEQAQGHLDPKDPAHGVVQAALGDDPFAHLLLHRLEEGSPVLRDHEQVDSRIQAPGDALAVIIIEVVNAVPVGDH